MLGIKQNLNDFFIPMATFTSCSTDDTFAIGASLAGQLQPPACIYLHGDMGAGKTTLVQAIVAALGYQAAVTSPTYNLIHEYATPKGRVLHLDLYRIEDPSELDYLGLPELFEQTDWQFIEWPERGAGYLPLADFRLVVEPDRAGHRQITLEKQQLGLEN